MSTSDTNLDCCPVADCGWKPRTAGNSVQRHISSKHGIRMPCGEYVPEGNGRDGLDRVKGHRDDCPRCLQDIKSPSGDGTGRSSASPPEPRARSGSGASSTPRAININKMTVHGTIIHNVVVSQTNIHTV